MLTVSIFIHFIDNTICWHRNFSRNIQTIWPHDIVYIRSNLKLNVFILCFPGFEKPSAIQQRSILPIVKGRDVIAQAQSGM